MKRQMSFSESEYANKKRVTRKEAFLAVIEEVVPWKRLEPYYPKGHRGRPPMGLERMLRLLVVQNCFGLSDEELEDAVYEIQSIRQFVGVDLNSDVVPDATTVLKFRRLLEEHKLARAIFEEVNASLAAHGLYMKQGTIVDATIIAAPSSTKNERNERDPEMHQTKKGNAWHFGMKAHIGVDAHCGLVHSVTATAANEANINQTEHLLHGDESMVFAIGLPHSPALFSVSLGACPTEGVTPKWTLNGSVRAGPVQGDITYSAPFTTVFGGKWNFTGAVNFTSRTGVSISGGGGIAGSYSTSIP